LTTQSDTTKAINYMLNQWQALVYYCGDGIAEIDNNIAENALRDVALVTGSSRPSVHNPIDNPK
jgi:transposase